MINIEYIDSLILIAESGLDLLTKTGNVQGRDKLIHMKPR
jgi:hypothetical protein